MVSAIIMNWAQPTNPFPAALDVIGLNYQGAGIRGAPGRYRAFHEKFPDKFIFSSETASALSSRGEYLFPVTSSNGAPVGSNAGEDQSNHQVSAYELYYAAFGASADKSGWTVPRACNRIHFDIRGPGEIVATDNGDPTSFELFQSHDRKAFNGLCLVIVRGKARQAGTIKLTARADGLKIGTASIKTIIVQ